MDPGSIAIGALVGTIFWLFALIYYFPKKFDAAERRIETKIEQKEAEYKALIPEMTTDIFAPIRDEFSKPIEAWDPKNREMVGNIIDGAMGMMIWHMSTNPENGQPNNKRLNDLINNKINGMFIKAMSEMPKMLAKVGPEIAEEMGLPPESLNLVAPAMKAFDNIDDSTLVGGIVKAFGPYFVRQIMPGFGQGAAPVQGGYYQYP